RVYGHVRGGERGPGEDEPESALQRGLAMGAGGGGGTGIVAGGGGAGRRDRAGIHGEWGVGAVLRGVAAGGGDGIHAALFPVVVRGKLCGGDGAVVIAADGRRDGAGEKPRVDGAADCVAAAAMGFVAGAGGAGICRRCCVVFPGIGRMCVRTGGGGAGAGGGERSGGDAREWALDDLAAGASGAEVCDWSRSGGRRSGGGLLVRRGDRSRVGDAVRGVARALSAAGVCGNGDEVGGGI